MHTFEQECPINVQENRKNKTVLALLQLFAKKVIIFLLKSCKNIHQSHIMKNQCVQLWGGMCPIDVQNMSNRCPIMGGNVSNRCPILGGKMSKTLNNFLRLYKYPLSENRALQGLYEQIRVLDFALFCSLPEIMSVFPLIFLQKTCVKKCV